MKKRNFMAPGRLILGNIALTCMGAVAAICCVAPARAVDTEVFFNDVVSRGPNILFVIDTSGSMWTTDDSTPTAYDPNTDYGALVDETSEPRCEKDAIYWSTGGSLPSCAAGAPKIPPDQFRCNAPGTATPGSPTVRYLLDSDGRALFNGHAAQRPAQSGNKLPQWQAIVPLSADTLCEGDPNPFSSPPKGWNKFSANGTFWTGNGVNHARVNIQNGTGSQPRIDVVRRVVEDLVENVAGVNIGLMRYSAQNQLNFEPIGSCNVGPTYGQDGAVNEGTGQAGGGMILAPVANSQTPQEGEPANPHQELLFSMLRNEYLANGQNNACSVPVFTPNGRTPMAETLLEAYFYLRGLAPDYGSRSNVGPNQPFLSVPESLSVGFAADRPDATYKSPITDECTATYIIVLSDGTTEQDGADGTIEGLKNETVDASDDFANVIGPKCDEEPSLKTPVLSDPSNCVNDIAKYMNRIDLAPGDAMPGVQNVTTYTVGFKVDSLKDPVEKAAALEVLEKTARDGGATCVKDVATKQCKQPLQYMRTADSASELALALQGIFEDILKGSFTFTAPAVAVNAFNRLENLNDLYYAVFEPGQTYSWNGNLKKYALGPGGEIQDANGNPAIEPAKATFKVDARSFWSNPGQNDGNEVTLGGAAGQLPASAPRNYLTDGGDATPVFQALTSVTDPAVLGIQQNDMLISSPPAPAAPLPLTAEKLVSWIAGKDIDDLDNDSNTDEPRPGDLGDPLHGRPGLVIYDGTPSNPTQDAAIFLMTNDGVLHAFNPGATPAAASTSGDPTGGREYWAYMPSALLSRARSLYYDQPTAYDNRTYGLDGALRIGRVDINNNGLVEDGDKVYLFFGMRRGGQNYYGLDVTDKTNPTLMWIADSLPGAADSWSTPSPLTKVRIGNVDESVIFVGGGFTEAHETQPFVAEDTRGNCVYMLRATDGMLLWRACGPGDGQSGGPGALLSMPLMKNAIAADVRVLDLSGDGFADRLYVPDLGGRIWRFDIKNGNDAGNLVVGGLFATLGTADDSTPSNARARRFFYTTDVAPVKCDGQLFLNLAIGSGHRELPKSDRITQDGFYSLRDYNVYSVIDTANYLTSGSCDGVNAPCHLAITLPDLQDVSLDPNPVIVSQNVNRPLPAGWKILFSDVGEKVLAESITFQGNVFFTTYEPRQLDSPNACTDIFGLNKLYIVSACNARPSQDLNRDGVLNEVADRSVELRQQGIAAPPAIIFPPRSITGPGGGIGGEPCGPGERPGIGITGTETFFPGCIGKPVRTFWRQRGVPEGG